MKTIWKHEINLEDIGDIISIEMPRGSTFLSVALQRPGKISFWFTADPQVPSCKRKVRCVGTGHTLLGNDPFIGTVVMLQGDFVLHFFDMGEQSGT